MIHKHPHGAPVVIMSFQGDDVLIQKEPLKNMLEHEDVMNRTIVAVSIIGAFRKGKSFFLDYCLRFLYAHYRSINYPDNPTKNPDKWYGDESTPLSGFSWRSGADRDTTGVIVWNDVFLHTDKKTDEEIAIIIMDTQGLFDNQTSKANNSRIFALGTMISSMQVFNLSAPIQEDHLEYLQFATEFTKFSNTESNSDKAFQNLMFLVRDWQNPDDFKLGIEGGEKYLDNILQIKEIHSQELKSVRKFIRNAFENVSCALLSNPGKIVTGAKQKNGEPYNGNWHDMDDDFREPFFDIIEYILKPERLVLKKMNGININATTFLQFILQFLEYIQSEDIKAQSAYELYVENQLNIVVDSCIKKYNAEIRQCKDTISKIDEIPKIHIAAKNCALLLFETTKKMGDANYKKIFLNNLDSDIENIYDQWKEQMELSIKQLEEEKEKTRVSEEEKQKIQLEKIIIEGKTSEMKLEMEKLKFQKELDREKFSKEMEIEKFKRDCDHKTMTLEKQYDREKFELQINSDREKLEKSSEIDKLRIQNDYSMHLATKDLETEKMKFDMDIQHQKDMREKEKDEAQLKAQYQAEIDKNNVEMKKIENLKELELEKLRQKREKEKYDRELELERIAAEVDMKKADAKIREAEIQAEKEKNEQSSKQQSEENERRKRREEEEQRQRRRDERGLFTKFTDFFI